jgi:hypothetical protein
MLSTYLETRKNHGKRTLGIKSMIIYALTKHVLLS